MIRKSGDKAARAAASAAACPVLTPAAAGAHDVGCGASLESMGQVFAAKFGTLQVPPFSAAAAEAHPLRGVGRNMRIVANVPVAFGSDLELAGDYAFVGSYDEGMVVIDISRPRQPRRVGLFDCPGGQNDIQLSPNAKWAVMAIETRSNECHPGNEGTVVLDISEPAHPREVAFIGRAELPYGSHNNTLDWPYLYVDQYVNEYSQLEIFSLRDPANPEKVGSIHYGGRDSHHDLQVEHLPNGKDYAYAASINFSDVVDVTNPRNPRLVQQVKDPQVTISHQAEANYDNSLLLVTDEYGGGLNTEVCGGTGDPAVSPPGTLPPAVTDPASLGALHIYRLREDGKLAGTTGPNGMTQPQKAGIFNIRYQPNTEPLAGCTIHVFWQARNRDRLTTAWYGRGTRVVDYSRPSDARQLGYFIPEGADTWSAKPHRGFIFTGDIVRGFDVLKYTGRGWPRNAPAADRQRIEQQGAVRCGGLRVTRLGTPARDLISGTSGRDVIVGLEGPDVIRALGGDDRVCGRDGKDRILGGRGDDRLQGGRGADVVKGGGGRDYIRGGQGADVVSGGAGRDDARD